MTPVFINQQNGTQVHTQAISLDLLKANGAPTLVTDSNGNHYLIALTSQATEGQNGVSSLAKTNGRITLQVKYSLSSGSILSTLCSLFKVMNFKHSSVSCSS